jgi:RecA-family ATPase
VDSNTYEELVVWNYVPPPALVEGGVLIENSGLVLFGEPKTFKSILAQQLAICIASGTPFLGLKVRQVPILYVQGEIPKPQFINRVKKMGANFQIPAGMAHFATTFRTKLDTPAGRDELLRHVTKVKPAVTFIDPMYRFISTSDENAVLRFLDLADELKSNYHQTVVIVHHSRKPQPGGLGLPAADSGGAEARGAHIEAWGDSILRITGNIKKDNRELSFELRNSERLYDPMKLVLDRNALWLNKI